MKKSLPYILKLEDCGRWFNDYVLLQGDEIIEVHAEPQQFTVNSRVRLARQIIKAKRRTGVEAKFAVEYALGARSPSCNPGLLKIAQHASQTNNITREHFTALLRFAITHP